MELPTGLLRWGALEAEAPKPAARGRALIEEFGFVFLGTLRRDGTPRISAVEAHVVGDDLMLVLIPATQKAADVRRDPRVVVQTPISNAADPGAELKLHGLAERVSDQSQCQATADRIEAVSGWRPDPSWLFLAVLVRDMTLMEWDRGEMVVTRWNPATGLQPAQRRRLDWAVGAYVPAGVRDPRTGASPDA